MKDGILSVEVESFKKHLNFLGPEKTPIKDMADNDHSQLLKGHIRLTLAKATKVKSVSVKFKGESAVNHSLKAPNNHFHTYQHQQQYHPQQDLLTPILPKLKSKVLLKPVMLDAGVHLIPWEIEIPDIYPRSFSTRGGFIRYRIEAKMTVGCSKVVIASQPIVIHRHLLSSRDTALHIASRIYEHIVQKKFLFELELPKIVYIDQGYIPINIMFKCIDKSPVKFISTQLIQIEIYKCRNVSKAEIDMAFMCSKKSSTSVSMKAHKPAKHNDMGLSRFFRQTRPVMLNTIDQNDKFDSIPLILQHQLDTNLLCGIESPIITIAHQIELTFNFGQNREEVRVKMPIRLSTTPHVFPPPDDPSLRHSFERRPHKRPLAVEVSDSPTRRSDSLHARPDKQHSRREGSGATSQAEQGIRKLKSAQCLLRGRSGSLPAQTQESKELPSLPPLSLPLIYAVNKASSFHEEDIQPTPISKKKSNKSLDEKHHPLTSAATFPTTSTIHSFKPSYNTFSGLPPPPRRTRTKKESPTDSYSSDSPTDLPVPTRSASASNIFARDSSAEPPLLSPFLSKPNLARPSLNISKSTKVPALSSPPLLTNKRASAAYTQNLTKDPAHTTSNDAPDHIAFAYMVASHYLDSSLPSHPSLTKRVSSMAIHPTSNIDNRMTKIYYEEDSDEDEDDDEDDIVVDKTENERESHVITC
ncbi:hypothetical protein A0J61_02932 [Choanephora cucurbitarum]|uniref:Uncharacterized protein n=1 Tax=Choanephora cucurbitarum TaxID=101091 RepID=A0A1C7NP33_9FUNG|nr:hypothetical protein A0J61_02932 [Choanephora cucurbitarum]